MKLKLELLIDVPNAETQEARDRIDLWIDVPRGIGEVLERKLEWIGDIKPLPPHDPNYVAPDCGPQMFWRQEDIPGDDNENQQWVADGYWQDEGVAVFQYRLRPIVHGSELCWQCHSDEELVDTDQGAIWASLEDAQADMFSNHLAIIKRDQA